MDIKVGDVVHVRAVVIDAKPDREGDIQVEFEYSVGPKKPHTIHVTTSEG